MPEADVPTPFHQRAAIQSWVPVGGARSMPALWRVNAGYGRTELVVVGAER